MISELLESFATGFFIGAVGATVGCIVYAIYTIVRDLKEDKINDN